MITQEEVTVFICDGCGARQVPPPDEEPIGYVIHRIQHATTTSSNFTTGIFACSESCLTRAIDNALRQAWDDTRPESAVG